MALNIAWMEVEVEFDDFMREHEKVLESGGDPSILRVQAEVDIDEALAEATIEQLRDALGRKADGYTAQQIDAVKECFEAAASGDVLTAEALLPRIFEHLAQISAAEAGLRTLHQRRAA